MINNEIIDISQQIQSKITILEKMRAEIRPRINEKAIASSEYDKKLAITLIKLKNGVEMELEGEKIRNPPASTCEKIARGICFQERLAMDQAEASYKSLISNIQSVMAEMNGAQSIFRYLDKGINNG